MNRWRNCVLGNTCPGSLLKIQEKTGEQMVDLQGMDSVAQTYSSIFEHTQINRQLVFFKEPCLLYHNNSQMSEMNVCLLKSDG